MWASLEIGCEGYGLRYYLPAQIGKPEQNLFYCPFCGKALGTGEKEKDGK